MQKFKLLRPEKEFKYLCNIEVKNEMGGDGEFTSLHLIIAVKT